MKIISGGQSGVDRAALDCALERGIPYGGWCPRGGWAEDFPHSPGVLAEYPLLRETPLAEPAQRTEWNVRDSHAILIVVGGDGLAASVGTTLAREMAERYRKPVLVIDPHAPQAVAHASAWLAARLREHGAELRLGIGGPRESEAPGIYAKAKAFLGAVLVGFGSAQQF